MTNTRFAATLLALLMVPAGLRAQATSQSPATATTAIEQTQAQAAPALRDRLMPAGLATALIAAAPTTAQDENAAARKAIEPVMAGHRSGTPYIIAGAALFVAGILIANGGASTVLELAGAGIGAYGLYLYFQ